MKFNFKTYLSNPFALLKLYREYGKDMYEARESIDKKSFMKLKSLCCYCKTHVPYYRKLFSEIDFCPEKMKTFEDFKKIPVMDKDVVREHFQELQSDEIKNMNTVLCSTSGSTGTPLKIYLDANVNRAIFCKLWRLWEQEPTWHIGKTLLTIDGDNVELANKKWFFNPKNRFLYFTPFHMKQSNIQMYYDIVKKYNPKIMKGYPSAIYAFGKYLEAAGLKLEFKSIYIHSESLLEFQKTFFENFFNARVVIQYGNNEKAGLIYGCKKGRLHSQDDYAFHEILDGNGEDILDGKEGRLVCTNLYNYAMPLLRYDTRDLASFDEKICDCGSHFRVIKHITGRASDVIYTQDGRIVSLIDSAFWKCDNIEMAHIYQPEKGRMIVYLVPCQNYSQEDEEVLMEGLVERCGTTMDIEIKHISSAEIPRTPAGKIRFIISDVEPTN